MERTHYDTLCVAEDASHDEIRAGYRSAVLGCHPDKIRGSQGPFAVSSDMEDRFLMVQNAWKILSNPSSRSAYDQELKASKLDYVSADDIQLEDMLIEETHEGLELVYPCRCGDTCGISSMELGELGFTLGLGESRKLRVSNGRMTSILLPCPSCSMKVRLMLNLTS